MAKEALDATPRASCIKPLTDRVAKARFQVVDKFTVEGGFTNFTYGTTTPIRLTR